MTQMTERQYALTALAEAVEQPLKTYQRSLRTAWRTASDSPENDAARAQGTAALLEFDRAVREYVAKHPA
jgi:hypothetical protein